MAIVHANGDQEYRGNTILVLGPTDAVPVQRAKSITTFHVCVDLFHWPPSPQIPGTERVR